jgi:hypothetical protein
MPAAKMVMYIWIEGLVRMSLLKTLTECLMLDAECARERGRRRRKGMYVVTTSMMSERRAVDGNTS